MKRVLVIDDELDICLMVTKHLKNLRFETDYALTVKQAHLKMSRALFDLMLVDLNLTDGSGFDVISYAAELNSTSKIIVISAYDNEASKSLEKGAALFMAKPFTIKTINEALKKLHFLPT